MAQDECMICYDMFENTIKCKCNSALCSGCFSEYSQGCYRDKGKLAKCVVCPREYLFECFCEEEPAIEYARILSEFLHKNPDFQNKVNTVTKEKRLIDQLRQKKAEIFGKMPAGIKYIIETVLMDKYKDAMKVNLSFVQKQVQKKKCFSGVCPTGNLDTDEDGNWICDTCGNTFCRKCEQIMFENHTCNKDDLESLQFISQLVHCPSCDAPVQKIDGCSCLTCSMCGTKFSELDGKKTDHGGHNEKLDLKEVKYTLSSEVKGKCEQEIYDFIKEYESEEPQQPDYDVFIPYLDADELSNDEVLALFEHYSIFRNAQYERKIFYSNILAMRQLFIDEQLTSENILKLFN